MSMRTIARSSSNRNSASALASSVLPTPVGPRNRNDPVGPVRVGDPGPGPAHGVGHRLHRGRLPDDAGAELVLHPQQLGGLALHQSAGRDAGPGGDDLGDVVGGHLLLDDHVAGSRLGLRPGTRVPSAMPAAPRTAVGRAAQVAVALRALDLALQLVDAFLDLTHPVEAGLLPLPPGVEGLELLGRSAFSARSLARRSARPRRSPWRAPSPPSSGGRRPLQLVDLDGTGVDLHAQPATPPRRRGRSPCRAGSAT